MTTTPNCAAATRRLPSRPRAAKRRRPDPGGRPRRTHEPARQGPGAAARAADGGARGAPFGPAGGPADHQRQPPSGPVRAIRTGGRRRRTRAWGLPGAAAGHRGGACRCRPRRLAGGRALRYAIPAG
ncbi:hypothetical protein G6F59_016974 [Rhizopus arrhizus]|nr:hypothetical protein G6F59_016974 [Rhizopus arrhizus]